MPSDHHGFIPSSAEEALRFRVKTELRKRMRGLRRALPATACAERSARIVEHLGTFEPLARAKSVALFWPFEDRHEVDLRTLDAKLRAGGAQIAYPAVNQVTRAMCFRFVSDVNTMRETDLGFREPAESEPEAVSGQLEAIVVPALAVDAAGYRVGYGAGYYDATLPAYTPPAVTIAVAFDFQLMPEVPATAGDVPCDWVVTDNRILEAMR